MRKEKGKKRVRMYMALLLAAVMLLGGCGNSTDENPEGNVSTNEGGNGESENQGSDDKITITVATSTHTDPGSAYLTQYIEDEFGIILDWQVYSAEEFSTQLSMMLSNDSLPDLIVGSNLNKADINEYGAEGYLLDMTQYSDAMPNLQKLMEENPGWAAYQKDENGAIYGLSRCFPSRIGLATGLGTFINLEWLENVGMEVPTTVDELYDVLVAFKEQDANGNGDPSDEIPLGIQIDTGRGSRFEWMLLPAFGIYTNNANRSYCADEDGTVYLGQMTDNYKDYLKYMHRLYEEGLMEPSAYIITDEERIDKTANDIYGVFYDYSGLVTAIGGQDEDENPYEKYAYITALTSDYNDTLTFTLGNCGYAEMSRTYISADTEYAEEICGLIDFFLSEEGTLVADYGKEGVTFEYTEDAFGNQVPSYINGYTSDTVRLDEAFKLIRTSVENSFVEEADDATLDTMIYEDAAYTYTSQAATEKALRSVEKLVNPFPDLTYTSDVADRVSVLQEDISNIILSYKSQFILGESDIDATWDQYMSDLEAAGVEELLSLVQDAYDDYLSNQ